VRRWLLAIQGRQASAGDESDAAMRVAPWNLRLHRNASERVLALDTPPSFESIVELLLLHMEVLCCHWQQCDLSRNFERAVFTVRVARPAFDWFFNSRNGYRAHYYLSEWDGLRANDGFLQAVTETLLTSDQAANANLYRLRESLLSPTAKVWLAEAGRGPFSTSCPSCRAGWSTTDCAPGPEIFNDRWENIRSNAGWGSRAPYLDLLRVMGAFIDDRNSVLVPWNKRGRGSQINAMGWS
jgi:hypothetical protein